MAVGSESHGRNMAWKCSFIFMFIILCKKSLCAESIYAETAKDIAVQRGKHAVISMQNLRIFSNDSIVCRVEVINDPICLRFGILSSYGFECNLEKARVSYIHSGSTISDEDCLKVKVLLFYNDRTERKVRMQGVFWHRNLALAHILKRSYKNEPGLKHFLKLSDLECSELSVSFSTHHNNLTHKPRTGGTGGSCPQDLLTNNEVPCLFFGKCPFFLRKKCSQSFVPPKSEMLPTSLISC